MRKLFLLIPALVLSLAISADVIYINTETSDALRKALNNAQSGDIIEMAAGTYVESPENWIAFTAKNITVRAAEGAEVILQPQVSIRLKEGATAEFIGIKFDCGHLSDVNAYSDIIFPADATDGKNIILRNCEFYGWTQNNAIIYSSESNTLNSLIIEDCYFHDVTKSCVFLQNTSDAVEVQISNSTFANIATVTGSYYAGVIDMRSTTGSLLVDHCTFYNVQAMSTDYAAIGKIGSGTTAVVSNCIFAMPTSTSGVRTIRDAVTANNCLVYNYSSDSGYGMQGNVTKNNCSIANPLFTDAANGDYSFAGNWVTMELSPARGAATDGSDLGDPRWYSAEVLPSVDFASPYQFVGAKAQIAGNLWYDDVNEYLYYNNKSECGVATWKINATRACRVEATLNMNAATTTGHKFKVEVLDADGNSVGETAEPSQVSAAGDIALPDQIVLPAAGKYTVKLYNLTGWSSAKIDGVTFSYVGGDVQAMPGTTNIDDAWFSSNGTRTAGEYIAIPSGHQHEGWVKWNVSFAEAANYNVTVNIDNANGHNYTVALYTSESDESPITIGEGGQKSTVGTLELGALEVPAGNYIMKVTNATQYSDAKLISVKFSYAGGAAVDLSKDAPASLLANADAIVSDDWTIEDGKITHAESKALTGWAKWNVNCADYANYNVTVNISSDNGHLVRVEIFEDEAEPAIYTLDETEATKYHEGNQAIDLGNIVLGAREYVVKVSNTAEYSHVQIASIVISYEGGALVNLPNDAIPFADAILSENATRNLESNPQEIHFGSPNASQYAKWNIHAVAGLYTFTFDVVGTNYGTYKLDILEGNDNIFTYTQGKQASGQVTISKVFIPAEGDYVLQLANTNSGADGYLTSLAATAATDVFVLDENTEDDGSIAAAAATEEEYTFLLKRSFTAGKYYTICLPVSSWDSELKLAFGADYELWKMTSAEQNGDEIALNFEKINSEGFSAGKPYIIKPSVDVVNPILYNKKQIKNSTYNNVQEFAAADFVGTFYKDEIPAGETNLYLQNNELFYNENNNTPIKGTRAWVRLKSQSAAAPRARIVLKGHMPTYIDLVNGEKKTVKALENGQVVIIRDGQKYNVMGIKLQ